jgi:hypothetical protein
MQSWPGGRGGPLCGPRFRPLESEESPWEGRDWTMVAAPVARRRQLEAVCVSISLRMSRLERTRRWDTIAANSDGAVAGRPQGLACVVRGAMGC